MAPNPMDDHHAITICGTKMWDGEPIRIPLIFQGVTSYFPTRKPMKEEYENTADELWIELTAESPEWDPTLKCFQEQENGVLNSDGSLNDPIESWNPRCVIVALHII